MKHFLSEGEEILFHTEVHCLLCILRIDEVLPYLSKSIRWVQQLIRRGGRLLNGEMIEEAGGISAS